MSQCFQLSVVVGNMYPFVWLLLPSSVHTTKYSMKVLNIRILFKLKGIKIRC